MALFSTATTNFDKTVQTLINTKLEELLRAGLVNTLPGSFIKATFTPGTNGTMRFLNVPDIAVDATEAAASLVVTEGSPNATASIAVGYEEFTTRQRMKTLKMTDVSLLESPLEVLALNAERLARYVMELADFVAKAKIVAGTNVIFSDATAAQTNANSASLVAGTDILQSRDIKRGVAILAGDSVPTFGDGTYRGTIHPYVKLDVTEETADGGWIDANRYVSLDSPLFTGELGRYAGVRFIQSSKAPFVIDTGGSSADVYSTVLYGPNFFAIGDFGNNETFITPPGGHDDPGHQSGLITWKGWMDAMLIGEGVSATDVSGPRYIRIESVATLGDAP